MAFLSSRSMMWKSGAARLEALAASTLKQSASVLHRCGGCREGPMRRGGALPVQSTPNTIDKSFGRARGSVWQNDMFEDSMEAFGVQLGFETGTKLYISNLDYGISNDYMKQLFSEVGELKRCSIRYDRSGRSKGIEKVVF